MVQCKLPSCMNTPGRQCTYLRLNLFSSLGCMAPMQLHIRVWDTIVCSSDNDCEEQAGWRVPCRNGPSGLPCRYTNYDLLSIWLKLHGFMQHVTRSCTYSLPQIINWSHAPFLSPSQSGNLIFYVQQYCNL